MGGYVRGMGGYVRGMGGYVRGMGGYVGGWVAKLVAHLLVTASSLSSNLDIHHKWAT
jgi:hypothetical protein